MLQQTAQLALNWPHHTWSIDTLNLWYQHLGNEDIRDFAAAVRKTIGTSTERFMPPIGHFVQHTRMARREREADERWQSKRLELSPPKLDVAQEARKVLDALRMPNE